MEIVINVVLLLIFPYLLYNEARNFLGVIKSGVEQGKLNMSVVIRIALGIILMVVAWVLLYLNWPEGVKYIECTPIEEIIK